MGTIFVDNIKQQSSQGSGTITIGASGETVALASGVKQSNLLTPAFEAYLSSDQNLTDSTYTKIQFDTEGFDTDNCYDNSTNYRFTPTVAGKYLVYSTMEGEAAGTNTMYRVILAIYKNDSIVARYYNYPSTSAPQNHQSVNVSRTIDMNGTSDYLEIFGFVDPTSSNQGRAESSSTDLRTYFGAFRIGS